MVFWSPIIFLSNLVMFLSNLVMFGMEYGIA
jgi:hypothetical protein